MSARSLHVDGREIELSSLDKVYFPDQGVTKGDLVDYYQRIAGTMLPHVRSRPLSMQRYPDGIEGEGFYQKQAPDHFPDWIERVEIEVEEDDEVQPQVVCQDAATLVYLAQQACITPHIWLSRMDELRHPDKLIFDLDPAGDDFEPIRAAARDLRQIIDEIGLVPFVMTTGSRGLHVVVPLERGADFDQVRAFAKRISAVVADRNPDRYTTEVRKDKRQGRLFLDYLRNAYAQTSVAPYAVRAKPGAPVAVPLDWDELGDSDLHSQSYSLKNIFRRLGHKEDPWVGMMSQARSIEAAQRKLAQLEENQ